MDIGVGAVSGKRGGKVKDLLWSCLCDCSNRSKTEQEAVRKSSHIAAVVELMSCLFWQSEKKLIFDFLTFSFLFRSFVVTPQLFSFSFFQNNLHTLSTPLLFTISRRTRRRCCEEWNVAALFWLPFFLFTSLPFTIHSVARSYPSMFVLGWSFNEK